MCSWSTFSRQQYKIVNFFFTDMEQRVPLALSSSYKIFHTAVKNINVLRPRTIFIKCGVSPQIFVKVPNKKKNFKTINPVGASLLHSDIRTCMAKLTGINRDLRQGAWTDGGPEVARNEYYGHPSYNGNMVSARAGISAIFGWICNKRLIWKIFRLGAYRLIQRKIIPSPSI